MKLYLVGPNEGKNIKLAGFRFIEGVTEIPDDAGDAKNLLVNFHNAHPESSLEEGEDGQLQLKVVGPVETDVTLPHSNGTIGATRMGVASREAVDDLDEAGGIKDPTGNAKPAGRKPKSS